MKSHDIKLMIEALTGLSAEQQATTCFDSAYEWLDLALDTNRQGLQQLPMQPNFWTWWTRNWELVDRGFIDSVQVLPNGHLLCLLPGRPGDVWRSCRDERELAEVWRQYHSPIFVQANQQLLRTSYHEAIRQSIVHRR